MPNVRPVVILPASVLREVAKPVKGITDEIRALMDDMLATMYASEGIGLAANQIGETVRVLVMDVAKEGEESQPCFMANPEIIWSSEEQNIHKEGCLSIPEVFEEVERPASVRVTYLDYHGQPQELLAEELLATCVQHEIDHLNGVLFIDHISRLKRSRIVTKFTKAAKRAQ